MATRKECCYFAIINDMADDEPQASIFPSVTNMCPAVAMGLAFAQLGQLSADVAETVNRVSDIMNDLAREERLARLAELDEMIERSKARRRTEGE